MLIWVLMRDNNYFWYFFCILHQYPARYHLQFSKAKLDAEFERSKQAMHNPIHALQPDTLEYASQEFFPEGLMFPERPEGYRTMGKDVSNPFGSWRRRCLESQFNNFFSGHCPSFSPSRFWSSIQTDCFVLCVFGQIQKIQRSLVSHFEIRILSYFMALKLAKNGPRMGIFSSFHQTCVGTYL